MPTPHFYAIMGYQYPKQGDYYLSAQVVVAQHFPLCYKAPNDLSTKYLVVHRLQKAIKQEIWVASLD